MLMIMILVEVMIMIFQSLEKESFRQRQSLLEEISRLKEREELVKRKEEEIQR